MQTRKGYTMSKRVICIFIILCGLAVIYAQDKPVNKTVNPWEETIRTFEDWDRKNSFPSDAVLFVGSSSIRLWPTRECFAGLEVINRGFGGSKIYEVNYFANRIVLPYKPKLIVFYAGDNDIAGGMSAQQVFEDYQKFVKIVHNELPDTRIIFISIKPCRSRWSFWPAMDEANNMIRKFSDKNLRLFYFDGAAPLLDNNGEPKDELFLEDKLHLNSKGYDIWTKLLCPTIETALKSDISR